MDLYNVAGAKCPAGRKILDSGHDSQSLSRSRGQLLDTDAGCCTEQKRYCKPAVPVKPAQNSALR